MRIIPVIDLKQGQVVRGIGGRRSEYQPIVSPLVESATPSAVAQAFVQKLGLNTIYVADLDAIAGAEPDLASYEQIAAAGARLWIDAGIKNVAGAAALAQHRFVDAVIVGLETLANPQALATIVTELSPARVIFSLDLKSGMPLTRIVAWRGLSSLAIVREVIALGITRLIVLDLAAVGSGEGPAALPLLQDIHREFAGLELIGGGGVRDEADLAQLAAAGCRAALVASALHSGRITRT